MPTVHLDNDIYEFLQRKAVPFEEGVSDTLRRLLGIDPLELERSPMSSAALRRRRSAKADLYDLVQAGVLHSKQRLFLHDFQGRRVDGAVAEVGSVNKLVRNGKRHSMSRLASDLLAKQGYRSGSVRGPAHWFTEEGESVQILWERYQKSTKTSKKESV